MIDHAPLVLFALDGEGVFTLSTGKGLEALGLGEGEIVGQSVFDVCRDYPHMLDVNRRALGGESVRESVRLGSLEFDVRVEPSLDPDGQVIGATGIALDTTEQRALETQLRQSQKMNAIGQMAGGIAHDFNNLLTAIAGHCELLLEGLHDRPDLRNHPEEIARTVDLAASLTQRLLAFGRRGIVRPETLDLNEVLTGMQLLLGGLVPETIGLVVKRSPGRSWVLTDRVQLEQAVINLVVNARDAMPEGGTLRLTTEQRAEPPARAVRGLEPAPGPYVVLSVQDTGHGIDPEIEEQMFEPFFTTKGTSASGLGLFTVYGIVAQCRVTLAVESQVGGGTTLCIFLPRATPRSLSADGQPELEAPPGVGSRIFVIEDNAMVRQLTVRVLERSGFDVQSAESAEAARELLSGDGVDRIDLLLSDIVLPGQSGTSYAAEVSRDRPDLKVVFMSGYPHTPESKEEVSRPGASFLRKPFTPRELVTRIQEILEAS